MHYQRPAIKIVLLTPKIYHKLAALSNKFRSPIAMKIFCDIIREDNGLGGCGKEQVIRSTIETGIIPKVFSPLS